MTCGCHGSASTDGNETHPSLERVEVVSNDRVTEGVGLMVLRAPRTARSVRPGQFVHLRLTEDTDFILRRPFSVHRWHGEFIEILYQVLGTGTRAMSRIAPGAVLDLIGPLGSGWRWDAGMDHALLVAGGLGAAPLGGLAECLADAGIAVTVAMGAPTSERLVGRGVFEAVARRVACATDDGTEGHCGFVTGPVEELLASGSYDVVYACGPEVMQRAVVGLAKASGVPCQVSLERLMGCGIGACLSCVVGTTRGLKRACVDGPVFDAEEVLWDASEVPPRH